MGDMKARLLVLLVVSPALTSCGSNSSGGAGGGGGGQDTAECFSCEGYWTCGEPVSRIDLVPEPDGCLLSGLDGRNLLSRNGTITSGGVVVGNAIGSGARVHVMHSDGSQWLFCAGVEGCP